MHDETTGTVHSTTFELVVTLSKRATLAGIRFSGLGPYEGLGVFVGDVQVAVDGSLQFGAALMHAPAQLLFGEQTEPARKQGSARRRWWA